MKKILLATVLVAASVAASAQVAVYGLVREYVDNTKVGSVSVTSMTRQIRKPLDRPSHRAD